MSFFYLASVAMAEQTVPPVISAPVAVATEEVSPITKPESMLYKKELRTNIFQVYKNIFTALENNGYFVLFEPNIGKNLSHFAQRWGKDYNKNKLEEIRSMVICNGWYANQISNLDPDMLALCPLRVTFIYKEGVTTVVFVRPSKVAANSPALKAATELEQDLIRTIEGVMK